MDNAQQEIQHLQSRIGRAITQLESILVVTREDRGNVTLDAGIMLNLQTALNILKEKKPPSKERETTYCKNCGGDGWLNTENRNCPACNGTGEVEIWKTQN